MRPIAGEPRNISVTASLYLPATPKATTLNIIRNAGGQPLLTQDFIGFWHKIKMVHKRGSVPFALTVLQEHKNKLTVRAESDSDYYGVKIKTFAPLLWVKN